MIPFLTRIAAKTAAIVVLVLGTVIGGQVAVNGSASVEERDPRQIAADELRAAQASHQSTRHEHEAYIVQVADADAESKAELVAEIVHDRAMELDDAEQTAVEMAEAAAAEEEANSNPTSVDIPSSCDEFDGNRATGCALAMDRGYDMEQFACVEELWNRESGWNHRAENPSGAYGIPQSRPGSKMAEEGSDWRENPVTQINWGFGYIEGRYGTLCDALATSDAQGWY